MTVCGIIGVGVVSITPPVIDTEPQARAAIVNLFTFIVNLILTQPENKRSRRRTAEIRGEDFRVQDVEKHHRYG